VTTRDYHPWDREHLTIDTAGRPVADCVEDALAALWPLTRDPRKL
jgi:hypothetical protein